MSSPSGGGRIALVVLAVGGLVCAHSGIVAVALGQAPPSQAKNVTRWARVDLLRRFALPGAPLWHRLTVQRRPREVQSVALAARSPEERRDGAAAAARALEQDDRGHRADLGPGLQNVGGPGVGPRQRQPQQADLGEDGGLV